MDARAGRRHLLTGSTSAGRSVFAPEETVTEVPLAGFAVTARFLGGHDETAVLPAEARAFSAPPTAPPPGGWRFSTLTIDAGATGKYHEMIARSLGGSEQGVAAGFHRTATVDLIIVLAGEFVLELDDGAEGVLRAGDTAILNGVRHRWHNRGSTAATLAAVMIGAHEKRG